MLIAACDACSRRLFPLQGYIYGYSRGSPDLLCLASLYKRLYLQIEYKVVGGDHFGAGVMSHILAIPCFVVLAPLTKIRAVVWWLLKGLWVRY
jgi:hypothetical protein